MILLDGPLADNMLRARSKHDAFQFRWKVCFATCVRVVVKARGQATYRRDRLLVEAPIL